MRFWFFISVIFLPLLGASQSWPFEYWHDGKIVLEEGVWIGAQSVVCPNVLCKSHSILSVSSVANKDLEAHTIYQGNPALPIRKRTIE